MTRALLLTACTLFVACIAEESRLFCGDLPVVSSKLQCDVTEQRIEYRSVSGELFSEIRIPKNVKRLGLRGVRFADDRISSHTFSDYVDLQELVCTNCSIKAVEADAFRTQSETLERLELNGNRRLDRFEQQQLNNLRVLKLSGTRLSRLPSVQATNLQELYMDGSASFSILDGAALSKYVHLRKLNFNGLRISRIETAHTEGLPSGLRSLVLTGCAVEHIDRGAFSALLVLELLNLASNKLDAEAVRNVSQGLAVQSLLLSGNERLSTLPNDLFLAIQPTVESIDLSRCPLRIVQDGLFANMARLTSVNLRACAIETIEHKAFEHSDNLKWLNLAGNMLTRQQWKPENLPKGLTSLGLSDNEYLFDQVNLNKQHFSQTFSLLETLRLRNCSVSQISSDAFEQLHRLKELDLSMNKLSSVPDAVCRYLPPSTVLQKLDISGKNSASSTLFQLPTVRCPSLKTVRSLVIAGQRLDVEQLLRANEFWANLAPTELDLSDNLLQDLLKSGNLRSFLSKFGAVNQLLRFKLERSLISGLLDLSELCTLAPNLEQLLLTNNRLTQLSTADPDRLVCTSLRRLGLRNNSLVTLEKETLNMFCSMRSLSQLVLADNSFKCQCDLAGFWDSVESHKYEVGSVKWTFLESINKLPQRCNLNGVLIPIVDFGQKSCTASTSNQWSQCLEQKRQIFIAPSKDDVSVDRAEKSSSLDVPSSLPASSGSNAGSGYLTSITITIAAILLAIGGGLYYARRFRRSGQLRHRQDIPMQLIPTDDDTLEEHENERLNVPEEVELVAVRSSPSDLPRTRVTPKDSVQPQSSSAVSPSPDVDACVVESAQPAGSAAPERRRRTSSSEAFDKAFSTNDIETQQKSNSDCTGDSWDANFKKLTK